MNKILTQSGNEGWVHTLIRNWMHLSTHFNKKLNALTPVQLGRFFLFFYFFNLPEYYKWSEEKLLTEEWTRGDSLGPLFGSLLKEAVILNSVWLPMQEEILHG